ncbi:hypothetical protein OWR29_26280 [Actinoplanes sp. Pm04-4]|uniref:Uncharacterized protein n=1 Tax=Paractinoplanes pyxinae TaxID=2997416 RepID=A0ABT4B6P2_9ACTN|nr:hypothetical protein [Actinoplanes pyxinae]MCY1141520.1 hypothetical protein [Actinoplanes pyxinae]
MNPSEHAPDPTNADTTGNTESGHDNTDGGPQQPGKFRPLVLSPQSGIRLLTAGEAIDAIHSGDHPQSSLGSTALDVAAADALRAGAIVACLLPDGQLAFILAPATPPPV